MREAAKLITDQDIGMYISNRNLLDNPWFTVNQRGASGYSTENAYTVDRWRLYNAGSLAVTSNGVTLTGVDSEFYQKIETDLYESLVGKEVTCSVLLQDGTIYCGTITIPAESSSAVNITIFENSNLKVKAWIQPSSGSDYNNVSIINKTSTAVNIRAMKLEVGTRSTLHLDAAPNYVDELLRCQRYYVRMSDPVVHGYFDGVSRVIAALDFPVELRASIATYATSDKSAFTMVNPGAAGTISSIGFYQIGSSKRGLLLDVTLSTSHTQGSGCIIRSLGGTGAWVEASADL